MRDALSDAPGEIESGPSEGGAGDGDDDAADGFGGVIAIHIPPAAGDASAVFGSGGLLIAPSLEIGDAAVSNLRVIDLRVRPDGRIVVLAGDPISPSCTYCSDHDVLLQGTSDGTGFDPTFGGDAGSVRLPLSFPGSFPGGGIVRGDGSASFVLTTFTTRPGGAIALQDDGKILVIGTCVADAWPNQYVACVERVNADGTIDVGFGSSGVSVLEDSSAQESRGLGIALDGARRVLVLAGWGNGYGLVSRLTPDGVLDATFASGGGALLYGGQPRAIAVQSTGRVLVLESVRVGSPFYPYVATRFNLEALNHAGVADPSFAGGAGAVAFDWKYTFPPDTSASAADQPTSLIVTGNDSIVAMGTASLAGSSTPLADWKASIGVARLTPDGVLDSTFGAAGRIRIVAFEDDTLDTWSIVPLGSSFYIAARASAWQETQWAVPLLLKLRPDGLLESTYPENGGEGVLRLPFALELSSQFAQGAGGKRLFIGAANVVDGGPDGILIARPPL